MVVRCSRRDRARACAAATEDETELQYDLMVASVGLSEVRVRGFRSLLDVTLRPGAVTALVGEASAGKSNLLAAVGRTLTRNALIRETAGGEGTVALEPGFEGVAGLRGHCHKPEKAWLRFRSLSRDDVPSRSGGAVAITLSLARD